MAVLRQTIGVNLLDYLFFFLNRVLFYFMKQLRHGYLASISTKVNVKTLSLWLKNWGQSGAVVVHTLNLIPQ